MRGQGSGVRNIAARSAKDLTVYQKAYVLAMKIYEASKRFPAEEKYALTSQIRRSSRSVCLNLREAWAKRRYEAHFLRNFLTVMVKTVKPTYHSTSPEIVASSALRCIANLPH